MHPRFREKRNETEISIERLRNFLIHKGKTNESHFKKVVTERITEILRLLFLTVKDKLGG